MVTGLGEADFAALAARRSDLDVFIRRVADTPLDTLPDGPERLAHMINDVADFAPPRGVVLRKI